MACTPFWRTLVLATALLSTWPAAVSAQAAGGTPVVFRAASPWASVVPSAAVSERRTAVGAVVAPRDESVAGGALYGAVFGGAIGLVVGNQMCDRCDDPAPVMAIGLAGALLGVLIGIIVDANSSTI